MSYQHSTATRWFRSQHPGKLHHVSLATITCLIRKCRRPVARFKIDCGPGPCLFVLQVTFGPNLEAETEVKVQFSGEELYGKVSGGSHAHIVCCIAVGGARPP